MARHKPGRRALTTGAGSGPSGELGSDLRESGMDRLRIYGNHDDKAIRQMQNCMEVGSAHRGVLCADGHYGYAHSARLLSPSP